MLNKRQFDLLDFLAEEGSGFSEKAIAEALGYSVEIINSIYKELSELGYLENNEVSGKGYEALEPYRVKRAVFLAAGKGERMNPITLSTPKPLVRVHGVRIIDRLLDAVLAAGIEEIYIVRGYLGEVFDQLLSKYPMIKFIDNLDYNKGNNIISVVCAGETVVNAYLLESDLLLMNPNLIRTYQYSSNALGIPVEYSNDWCYYSKEGIITGEGFGGENCHQIAGITYWNEPDGKRLVEHYKAVYRMPDGKNQFAGYAPFVKFIDEYKVYIRECKTEDIVEIDSFEELQAIDEAYKLKK